MKEIGSGRRLGDQTAIPGDYQFRALTEGGPIQRFWHLSKQITISQFMPPAAEDFIIDVGCGSGVITAFLAGQCAHALGVDNNRAALDFAKASYPLPNLSFQEGFVDEDFDVHRAADKVYCLEVIEHIHEAQGESMLRAFYRALRPGGKIFLTTPNYRSHWPLIEWTMDTFRLAPRMAESQHVMHYTMRRLKNLIRGAGFKIERGFTISFMAPWTAPFGVRVAQCVHRAEVMVPHTFGCILVCVARKPLE